MCGIAGIWNTSQPEDAPSRLAFMLNAMQHRGPDGRGMMRFAGGAAGMVRLALVDPTDRGQQPFWSADRRVAILFNGEIYNFREERRQLEQAGHQFRSSTDTEVILHLYLEYGTEFVHHLRGMFAIALFDFRQTGINQPPQMILVRGHFGIKPLYIANIDGEPGSVIFGSEIRGLLASGLVARRIDTQSLAEYLSSGFVWQPRTMISGIRMLEPGTLEVYQLGRPYRAEQFWKMPRYEPQQETLEEAAERLRATFDESIRLHAFADAPVGAFLSGGIDSTGIVGLMRKHVPNLNTYTLRFPELAASDESAEAVESANLLEVRNTVVDVTGSDVVKSLPQFASDLDQPSTDGFNTWLISRAAASDVKGVLSGLGGDEWFAGYPVTRRMSRCSSSSLGWTQSLAAHLAAAAMDLVPDSNVQRRIASLAARRSRLSTWTHAHSVLRWEIVRRSLGLNQPESTEFAHYESTLAAMNPDWRRESAVGLSFLLDTRVYMINQLLRDSDATSMAHSLELRVPFVDLEMLKFSRTCLDHHKLRWDGGFGDDYVRSGSKRVLIHALHDVLPLAIAGRPKRGFVVPMYAWMKTNLKSLVEETCHPTAIERRGLIDPRLVAQSWKQFHRQPTNTDLRELWGVMILELWSRAVLDQSSIAASVPVLFENNQIL